MSTPLLPQYAFSRHKKPRCFELHGQPYPKSGRKIQPNPTRRKERDAEAPTPKEATDRGLWSQTVTVHPEFRRISEHRTAGENYASRHGLPLLCGSDCGVTGSAAAEWDVNERVQSNAKGRRVRASIQQHRPGVLTSHV